ncbi:MAG TPA: DUF485 domain-containing protein, partial [Acidobacteriota bacterium]|nr:DUF485 domain-containing protein [Acidobacteriota bacterium]
TPKKARLGIILFIVYMVIYAGFVIIGTTIPQAMGIQVLADLNLAVVYGMGLIVLAAVLGVFYNHICTKYERQMNREDKR